MYAGKMLSPLMRMSALLPYAIGELVIASAARMNSGVQTEISSPCRS